MLTIILLILYKLWENNILFSAPEITIHPSKEYSESVLVRLYAGDGFTDKYPLSKNNDLKLFMGGVISEDYKKEVDVVIEPDNYDSTSFETKGEFRTVDIYLDEKGRIDTSKTIIVR